MFNRFSILIFFASSFSPLWLIFFVLSIFKDNIVAGVSGFLFLVGVISLALLIRLAKSISFRYLSLSKITPSNELSLSYVATYLIPFMTLDLSSNRNKLSLIIFIAVIAYIYIHSRMIHLNPVLFAFGYYIYSAERDGGVQISVISKQETLEIGRVKVVELSKGIYLEV